MSQDSGTLHAIGRRAERKRAAREDGEDLAHDRRAFPCPACGANLRFDPGSARLSCGHCGSQSPVPHVDDAAAQVENPYGQGLERDMASLAAEEAPSVDCTRCGASIEFHADEHARICPFCDAALVGDVRQFRRIVPQGLLPFALDHGRAHDAMHGWLKSRWFAPNDIAEEAQASHFHGIYVPFWTYDADTATAYSGARGTRVGSGKNRRTVWKEVTGTVSGRFDDVVVSGSRSVSAEFSDGLAPWPLRELETYQTEFLAGFRAENHTIGVRDGFARADRTMQATITDWIRRDIGGQRQRIHWSRTNYSNQTFKHILVPVWITHYRFERKTFRLSVNGRTGKVYGQRPFSLVKLIAGTAALLAALSAVGFIISAVPWA
ncbi:MAG: primosomal protein N' (replication factor Y) - superfamily II helicase [Alphaproteobacteria bacterium]